ncbi:class II glutamine amidotransferase [Cryobacterium sp. CG_9.6]|uniref:class II glutamine amidotransferase n=1 Tax=Cryobacterium sp. CG_9.6 TaxID=2760710 RepID=UPI0024736C32|nr:class II glutamine amidotransferase [Cryobacterium sp. CG_9.6]MDH6235474.1 putative glutamine amidotransferase [Cryobacterium sp. CG_9.6]
MGSPHVVDPSGKAVMCRLLAYASPTPRTTRDVLGGNQSAVFQDMTELHKDGWGSAWIVGDTTRRVKKERSALTGEGDQRLTEALSERLSRAQLVHLRMATDGMACQPANTHPFVRDGFAFAHNGSLAPASAMDDYIAPHLLAALDGDTDSERYLAVIRTKVAEGNDLFEAVCQTVLELRPIFPDLSMNAMILSPTELIAVHASEDADTPHDMFDASGLTELTLPQDHRTAYYLMRQRRYDDGTIVFASSGLDIVGWEPLPAESVTRVNLTTLESTTRLLDVEPSVLARHRQA